MTPLFVLAAVTCEGPVFKRTSGRFFGCWHFGKRKPQARRQDEKLATVLVRVPYGRLEYGEGLNTAEYFARRGYAVLVQDLRGTSDSEGELVPYRGGIADGAATLDWIVAQPWSNGRVGSFGCSALGESQYVLALTTYNWWGCGYPTPNAYGLLLSCGAGSGLHEWRARWTHTGTLRQTMPTLAIEDALAPQACQANGFWISPVVPAVRFAWTTWHAPRL